MLTESADLKKASCFPFVYLSVKEDGKGSSEEEFEEPSVLVLLDVELELSTLVVQPKRSVQNMVIRRGVLFRII